ncbi:MBL fold metallo-hydrolase [Haloplanus litoreus]|uniref:MBL fold metallo-hydrolase n=1 Tax=Haloplanus litoreus TaxID=767515 RepID=A0ABD6A223_9EURY
MERVSLSNASFEGENNAYLLADGTDTILIDTGDWTDTTRDRLRAFLRGRDLDIEAIDRIYLTHWHPDHTGLAGEIQSRSGASVHVHARDAPLVEGDPDSWAALRSLQERYFDGWGLPASKRAEIRDRMVDTPVYETPEVTPFEDGDVFSVNGRHLEVVHASGHAAGLCLFETTLDGASVVFSGDALLPVYTPNVGGADVRVERPLQRYLDALRTIADAGYETAWPGHRDPITDPATRAASIVRHHEERAWNVLATVERRGPVDTWTVSRELFGELAGIHALHGPGEVYAHLDHLERTGDVVSDGSEYRLAAGVADRLERRDGRRWDLSI